MTHKVSKGLTFLFLLGLICEREEVILVSFTDILRSKEIGYAETGA